MTAFVERVQAMAGIFGFTLMEDIRRGVVLVEAASHA